jgi:hypothetical protein
MLLTRFNLAVLRVAPLHPPTGMPRPLPHLSHWCHQGSDAGRGRSKQRLAIAVLEGASSASVEAFMRQLDGDTEMRALPNRLSQQALRLRVKAHDAMWWRPRQSTDPWDCGYLADSTGVRAALVRFRPRRATLMVADDMPTDALLDHMATLRAQAPHYRHAVRLLVLDAALNGDGIDRLCSIDP